MSCLKKLGISRQSLPGQCPLCNEFFVAWWKKLYFYIYLKANEIISKLELEHVS